MCFLFLSVFSTIESYHGRARYQALTPAHSTIEVQFKLFHEEEMNVKHTSASQLEVISEFIMKHTIANDTFRLLVVNCHYNTSAFDSEIDIKIEISCLALCLWYYNHRLNVRKFSRNACPYM